MKVQGKVQYKILYQKKISPEKGESAINIISEHSNTKDNKAKTKNPTKTENTKLNNLGNNTKKTNKQINANNKAKNITKDIKTKDVDAIIKQVKNNMYHQRAHHNSYMK